MVTRVSQQPISGPTLMAKASIETLLKDKSPPTVKNPLTNFEASILTAGQTFMRRIVTVTPTADIVPLYEQPSDVQPSRAHVLASVQAHQEEQGTTDNADS